RGCPSTNGTGPNDVCSHVASRLGEGSRRDDEKIENLDRNLAAVVDLVTELRRRELALGRGLAESKDDPHPLGHSVKPEEKGLRHLVDLPHARQELCEPTDVCFFHIQNTRDIAYPRWPEPLRLS